MPSNWPVRDLTISTSPATGVLIMPLRRCPTGAQSWVGRRLPAARLSRGRSR
jgi:hypothetical protein